MNDRTLFKSLNAEITKRLSSQLPVNIEDYDDEDAIVSFDGIAVIIPKDKIFADRQYMFEGSGNLKKTFDETKWGEIFLDDSVDMIGKDYFILNDHLHSVYNVGAIKGLTFDNALFDDTGITKLILLQTSNRKPRVLLVCSYVYDLKKVNYGSNPATPDDE